MACDKPVRECLAWHFQPRLAAAKLENNGNKLRATCPACGTLRAFTVSVIQRGKMMNCFNCGDGGDLRSALKRAGVDPGCLPSPRAAEQALAHITAVMQQGTRAERGQTHLRCYLIALGYRHWPTGDELVKHAAEIGVSRPDAYRAKKSGALLP